MGEEVDKNVFGIFQNLCYKRFYKIMYIGKFFCEVNHIDEVQLRKFYYEMWAFH